MPLVINTVTTLPPANAEELSTPYQPQLIHFSGIVSDGAGNKIDELTASVKSTGPTACTNVGPELDGLNFHPTVRQVADPEEVLEWFQSWSRGGTLIIGHNVHADLDVLAASAEKIDCLWDRPWRTFCTMYGSIAVGIVPLPTLSQPSITDRPVMPSLEGCLEASGCKPTLEPIQMDKRAVAVSTLHQCILNRLQVRGR